MSLDHATQALDGDSSRRLPPLMPERSSQSGTSPLAFAHDFRIGDWLVQPSLDRIARDGTDVRLRPQVMNMLVCLARGRGRTVSREQILDAVWPDQSVAGTSIARCVAELRKAIGDRVKAPAVIETIPKRGYRLIAPVSSVTDTGSGRLSTSVVTKTMPHGTASGELRLAAAPAPNPVEGTTARAVNAIETMPPAMESSPAVAAHDPVTVAAAVTGVSRRRAGGFMWVAGLVAAVAALLWPPGSR
jgi:DNA-binding winged helix-turn-helix (wHTH) protein